MTLRLLRALAHLARTSRGLRRALLALGLVASILGVGWLRWGAAVADGTDAEAQSVDGPPPRAILGRPWFDRYPEKPTEDVHLWLWFGGGIALHEHGSRYKATLEIFEFERAGATLDVRSLHDGKRTKTGFRVSACDERPPFDLCLDLDASPAGPRRLYSFGAEEDLARAIPWALSARRAAEERTRAPRP